MHRCASTGAASESRWALLRNIEFGKGRRTEDYSLLEAQGGCWNGDARSPGLSRSHSNPSLPHSPDRAIQREPTLGTAFAGLANRALGNKVHVIHQLQKEAHEEAEVRAKFFLSYKLMMREVHKRRGHHSWQANVLHLLHSPLANTTLICLLLIDITVVFIELFLEGTYPTCATIADNAASCCPLADAAMDAVHPIAALHSHPLGHGPGHGLAAGLGAGHQPLGHALRLLTSDIGPSPHGGASPHGVCDDPRLVVTGHAPYCDPHAYEHIHQLESLFSLATVLILGVFEVELIGMLLALDRLFFRSLLHLLDLLVISASLALQLYILLVRLHSDGAADEAEVGLLPDDITGLILFSRCWRFVRVGHGIATSINDIVRARQQRLYETVEELRDALRELERAISHADNAQRDAQREAHREAQRHRPPNGAAGTTGASKASGVRESVRESTSLGLHRCHRAVEALSLQAEY